MTLRTIHEILDAPPTAHTARWVQGGIQLLILGILESAFLSRVQVPSTCPHCGREV